tara:strand:+ start:307 stop:966 length:660 start_codon:yes stop_codon:yes gene_type:complete
MKVQIDVPDSLKEITLEQYQKYEKLNTEDNKDTTFLQQKMVEVFCNLNLKDVASIKYKSVQEITQHLNKIFNVKTELTTTFKLGDKEFGFIPMLDDITLGEYIDLDTYLAEWANMHKAMNVLYRPIKFKKGNKYNIEDYKKTDNTELFKHIPLNVVMGSLVFFWNLKNELLKTILNYLTKETEEMTMEQRLVLQGSGDGILQSLTLLKKMLPSLTILQT